MVRTFAMAIGKSQSQGSDPCVIWAASTMDFFLSGIPPILYIYIHLYIFLMANKLCCCCSIIRYCPKGGNALKLGK